MVLSKARSYASNKREASSSYVFKCCEVFYEAAVIKTGYFYSISAVKPASSNAVHLGFKSS